MKIKEIEKRERKIREAKKERRHKLPRPEIRQATSPHILQTLKE